MELLSTGEFGKDIKHLDKTLRAILQKTIEKIADAPERGKALGHYLDVFSTRIEGKRLVYHLDRKEQKITLMIYKKRDEVYDYLRQLYGK